MVSLHNPIFALPSYQVVQTLLHKYQAHPKKNWGQNFLVYEPIYRDIVAACQLQPGHRVIEIGSGLGTLTAHLLQTGAEVIAVEYEKQMCHVLRSELGQEERFTLLEKDALSLELSAFLSENSDPLTIVGNLPYQITSPLLFHFLNQRKHIKQMVFLIQREVAERLVASPNTSDYGALTAQVKMLAHVERICHVESASFFPQPKVDSTVIRLIPYEKTKIPVKDLACYQQVVKTAFSMRRKMIHHPLSSLFLEETKPLLREIGIQPERRAETLTIEEFVRIADILFERK